MEGAGQESKIVVRKKESLELWQSMTPMGWKLTVTNLNLKISATYS
jgi:hypothetical protein